MRAMWPGKGIALFLMASALLHPGLLRAQPTSATHADSGWVSVFDGKSFGDSFYVYQSKYVPISSQSSFRIENGMIRGGGPYALLVTKREYGYYRLRLEYRFGESVGGSANAGLMILVDNASAPTSTAKLRPRSIEVNCRRDSNYPWTLWASQDLGPWMQTTVKIGTSNYLSRPEGGVDYTVSPTGNRTLSTDYPNPELPAGQWNLGEAEVLGDSGVFRLNGRLRTSSWKWTDRTGGKTIRTARGGIGVQTEGSDISYRGWEIQELDSATLLPLRARKGCTDRKSGKYDPRAVVDDGTCNGTSARAPLARRVARPQGPLQAHDVAGRTLTARPATRSF